MKLKQNIFHFELKRKLVDLSMHNIKIKLNVKIKTRIHICRYINSNVYSIIGLDVVETMFMNNYLVREIKQ